MAGYFGQEAALKKMVREMTADELLDTFQERLGVGQAKAMVNKLKMGQ